MRWGGLLLLVPLFLAACWGAKEVEWHQKLTLHLQTPHGPAAFSSVTTMRCEAGYALDIGGTKVLCRQKGEALVAQLGERHLFALLAGEHLGYRGVFEALIEDGDTYQKYWKRIKRAEGRVFDVPRDRWPTFVSFEDIADPASVMLVDPDDLAASFGEGYALRDVTLEITDAPVTSGVVEGVLGWLGEYPEPKLCKPDGRTADIPLCMRIDQGSFTRRPR
jgi:hypothetical protein